jgi:NAD(P)-dependent dehydrogenase (short-subunit alcohol dehydrogenase family)
MSPSDNADVAIDLRDGVAVITGAGSGIGAALALKAGQLGMNVALADVATDGIEAVAAELRERNVEVLLRRVDVSVLDDVAALAAAVHARWDDVRLLVNNAGVDGHGRLWEVPPAQWAASVGVNLNGVYHGVHAFVPAMIASGKRAHVVNVASVAAFGVRPYMAPYIATKHACLALTECLDQELQLMTDAVRVSAVIPGPVNTEIIRSASTADRHGPGSAQRERLIRTLAEIGISPADAADIIFAGVLRGDLWIHTHPEASDGRIRARASTLLGRGRPPPAE